MKFVGRAFAALVFAGIVVGAHAITGWHHHIDIGEVAVMGGLGYWFGSLQLLQGGRT